MATTCSRVATDSASGFDGNALMLLPTASCNSSHAMLARHYGCTLVGAAILVALKLVICACSGTPCRSAGSFPTRNSVDAMGCEVGTCTV